MLDKSPAAIRRGLYTHEAIDTMAFEESMAFTESQIALFTLTEDAEEGQAAFQQKRKPQWKGSCEHRTIRIGGASGFWGDSSVGAPQLVAPGQRRLPGVRLPGRTHHVDPGGARKKPELGYATDFVDVTMKAIVRDVARKGIRVDQQRRRREPASLRQALAGPGRGTGRCAQDRRGEGDDVLPLLPQLREQGVRDMQSGAALPAKLLTANAYLGALPIRAAWTRAPRS